MTIFVEGKEGGVLLVRILPGWLGNSQHLRRTRDNKEMINTNELASNLFFTLGLVLLLARRRESGERPLLYALIFLSSPAPYASGIHPTAYGWLFVARVTLCGSLGRSAVSYPMRCS